MDTGLLDSEQYVSLVTFRRDGGEVATPVWFAGEGGCYYAFSAGDAWKLKRLARDPRVRLASCGVLGRVTGGWLEGSARVLDGSDTVQAGAERKGWALLREKYGWQLAVLDLLSSLAGRKGNRRMIEITLASPGTAATGDSREGNSN